MEHLPVTNAKAAYAQAGIAVAESYEIEDKGLSLTCRLKALDIQLKLTACEQRDRAMDQIDLLNHIKTRRRNLEVKNFDELGQSKLLPLTEPRQPEDSECSSSDKS